MPHFFFNLYDDTVTLDEEGKQLPDTDAAHEEAVRNAKAMACAEVLEGHLILDHCIEVMNERGEPVGTVRFGDVVKVEL